VIFLTILGWTTDILDGRLARRYHKEATWVGEREFVFDMVMVFSGLCYLVMSGSSRLLRRQVGSPMAVLLHQFSRVGVVLADDVVPLHDCLADHPLVKLHPELSNDEVDELKALLVLSKYK